MYFCAACALYVRDGAVAAHDQSTAHLLAATKAPTLRKVWLPESNRGYQMLKGMGWKEDAGLGPTGDGRVTPVATTFKTDRAGVGSDKQPPPRVTHFPPHDEDEAMKAPDGKSEAQRAQERLARKRKTEVAGAPLAVSKQQRKTQRMEEQARDRALHRELYADGMEGYEQFLQ